MLAGVRLAVTDSDLHKGDKMEQLSVNMVKTVLTGVHIVERGLQQFSGSDHPDQAIIVWSTCEFFLPYPGRKFLY